MLKTRTRRDRQPHAFSPLVASIAFSGTGTGISLVAIPLLASELLRANGTEIGLIRAAEFLPYFAFAFIVGHLTMRFGARTTLILGESIHISSLAAIIAVVMIGEASTGILVVLMLFYGCGTVTYDIAQYNLLKSSTDQRDLSEATSTVEAARSTAGVLGPSFGGFVSARLAPLGAVAGDLLFKIISLFLLTRTKKDAAVRDKVAPGTMREGALTLLRDPILRSSTILLGFASLSVQAALTALVADPNVRSQGDGSYLGIVLAAMSIGMVIEATVNSYIVRRLGVIKSFVGSLVLGAASLGLMSFAIYGNKLASEPYWLVVFATIFGFSRPLTTIQCLTMRLARTPSELLPGSTAVTKMVSQGAAPVGALIGGTLSSLGGAAFALIAVSQIPFIVFVMVSALRRAKIESR